jgi:zinc transport system ATP-binding protein
MTAIDVSSLTVQFGEITALEDVSFSLPDASYLAVLGPNGGGKSTLARVLMGLLEPASGTVRVMDRDPARIEPEEISYVPQLKTFDRRFPAIALELVVSGMKRHWPWRITKAESDAATEVLERVGVGELAHRPLAELSGGQLQRVYLARGLARQPKLIILDEPATGVDVPGQKEFYRLLEEYRKSSGGSIVLITHDWAVADHHATHLALISRRLVAFGAAGETLTDEAMAETFGHTAHAHPMSVGHLH